MIYHGHIQNGVAVLDTPAALADGTPVLVKVERAEGDFWTDKNIDELAREQGVLPIARFDDLVIDWPDEDPLDELMSLVREVRR